MGIRFRKSIKIANGVRLNLNKKSVGLSIGGKGAHVSVNSSGRKSVTTSIPGTGLSYTANLSRKKNSKPNKVSKTQIDNTSSYLYPIKPEPSAPWYRAFAVFYIGAIIFILGGVVNRLEKPEDIVCTLIGCIILALGLKAHKISRSIPESEDKLNNAPHIPMEQIQSVLLPNYPNTATWKELASAAQISAPNWWEIVIDSSHLIEETVNAEVYFSRRDLIFDCLNKLCVAECVIEMPLSAQDILELAKNEERKSEADFIDRSYTKMLEKAESLKTERGKRNRMINFYKSILKYKDKIYAENLEHLDKMMLSDGITAEECNQE